MSSSAAPSRQRIWARGYGVTLRPLAPGDLDAPGIQRALRDGIERNYAGPLPPPPPGIECYAIHAASDLVGVLAVRRDVPAPGAAVFDGIAIAPAHRGRAYAARALLAAERRLSVTSYYGRVPRTNGRGLYFMLRCGYAPVAPPVEDGATWFRRHRRGRPGRPRRPAPSKTAAAPAPQPSSTGESAGS